jgi:hypothetical protein
MPACLAQNADLVTAGSGLLRIIGPAVAGSPPTRRTRVIGPDLVGLVHVLHLGSVLAAVNVGEDSDSLARFQMAASTRAWQRWTVFP